MGRGAKIPLPLYGTGPLFGTGQVIWTGAPAARIPVAGDIFQDSRIGQNGWHGMTGQFRQSVVGRLGGYEEVTAADRR